MRRVLRWLAPLLLIGATSLPLPAQSTNYPKADSEPARKQGGHTPALEYTIAILFVILILVILCKPSRKA